MMIKWREKDEAERNRVRLQNPKSRFLPNRAGSRTPHRSSEQRTESKSVACITRRRMNGSALPEIPTTPQSCKILQKPFLEVVAVHGATPTTTHSSRNQHPPACCSSDSSKIRRPLPPRSSRECLILRIHRVHTRLLDNAKTPKSCRNSRMHNAFAGTTGSTA